MIHRMLGRKEWSGEIVQSVLDFDSEVRVRNHGFDEILLDIWRAGETEMLTVLVLPIPLSLASSLNTS